MLRLILAAGLLLLMPPAAAQVPQVSQPIDTSAIAADAQILAKQALQAAQATPQDTSNTTAKQITAFTPDPYAGSVTVNSAGAPGALAAMGSQQKTYQDMVQAQRTQPQFDPTSIKALVINSNVIAGNPQKYLGLDASGQPVTCQPVPTGTSPPVTYQSTCNTGATIQQQTQSCAALNHVTFTTTTLNGYSYLFLSATEGDTSQNPALTAQVASGACQISGSYYISGCIFSSACYTFWVNTSSCQTRQTNPNLFYEQPATITKTIPAFTKDLSACLAIDGATTCQLQSELCSDSSPATRVIAGNAVTAACWAWQRTYTCNSVTTGNSDCGALQANQNCRFDHTECLDANPLAGLNPLAGPNPVSGPNSLPGQCQVANQVYVCSVANQTSNTPSYICTNNIYCVNGSCNQVSAQPSQDFAKAVAALGTLSAVKTELDPNNITLFEGQANGCHKPLFGLENCCAGGPGIPLIGTCSASERQLALQFAKGITHYVGTYCSSSFLGICLSQRETFCVFQSKLGRIIQEQGRAQLGLKFGTAKSPVCTGLTPGQFAGLDLSKFDFSEVINDLTASVALPNEQATLTSMQAKIQAYFASHPGN